jgi:type IV secretory pathway protease TraF
MNRTDKNIPTLKTIKALRGQSLSIDLGIEHTGTLQAWMKKNPNDDTYRSFTIVDNRFLFLPKEKAQDYVDQTVEGKWYFDVREIPLGSVDPNDEAIIFEGVINFDNQITDSSGSEVEAIAETESGLINLSNTSSVYGTVGQVVKIEDLIVRIPVLKSIKALRGQSLSIDLGEVIEGDVKAWMKKDPTDTSYRSFTIVDGRYLFLPKQKAQDYYDQTTFELTQPVAGKWYFDVRQLPVGATSADDERTVFKGVIEFENQVTDSNGQELVDGLIPYPSEFIKLTDTPTSYIGGGDKVLKVNSTETGVEFSNIIEDKHYAHDQGIPSIVWSITHGLNKYPSVLAVDTANSVVVGQIEYIDLNNIKITFNASFSGSAYLN